MPEEYRVTNIMEDSPAASQQAQEQQGPQVAGIGERFVALLIDVAVVFGFVILLLSLHHGKIEVTIAQLYALFAAIGGLFVLYTALFSCGGRSTLGKKLVGIRVVDKDTAEPLSFFHALLRGCGYFLSALFLMCGFLLAFIDDKHRALQDYLGHSIVIQSRYKTWGEKTALSLTGLILMGVFGVYFYFSIFGEGSFEQQQLVNQAKIHMEKLAYLEDLHYKHYGYYTNDLQRLAILSGDPVQFQRDTQAVLSSKDFRIGVTKEGYKIKARAKNKKQTAVYWPSL